MKLSPPPSYCTGFGNTVTSNIETEPVSGVGRQATHVVGVLVIVAVPCVKVTDGVAVLVTEGEAVLVGYGVSVELGTAEYVAVTVFAGVFVMLGSAVEVCVAVS